MKTNFKGKFIVTLFLCFALCLAVLPFIGSTAFADGEHIHCVCGIADCDDAEHGEAKGFSVLDVDSGYLSGNYYLTEDFYLQNEDYFLVETGETLNLCLNGHNIVANEETFTIIYVECGGTFNLCDCKGTGCIMGVTNGKCAIWADSDEESSGNFNMYGGKICDNDVIAGGVYNLGNFEMYGGEISGNEAYYNSESEEVGNGGGVNNLGYFAMYGGKIFDNTATIGGGVYNGLDFEMYGGEISGNTATQNGGGVYNDSSFLMSGGEITNNEAVDDELMGYGYGDGVYARDYTTIAYFNNEKAVDGAKIIGNVKDNLYLESEVVITVKGSLTENSSIGITYSEELPQGGVKIIQGSVGDYDLTEEDVKKFKADVSGQTVIYDGTSFGWLTVKQHTHCSCGDLHCEEEGAGHEKIVFNGVTEYIPKDGFNGCHGNYYLENDISPSGFYEVKSGYTLNICLNGHVLSGNNLLQDNPLINNSGTLNIFDCDNTTTHKFVEETNKAWVHDDVSGTKTVNGGVITGVYSAYDNSAIYNTGVNSVFNLYGGTIAGNFVRGSFAGGGGVFVGDGAIFNMYNGAIVHNYSEEYGGGVYVASGSTFNMYNGTIANNSAMFGGAVIVSSGLESAVFNMSGGEITNNTATYGGGVTCYGEFVMSGGSITNNTATYYGGGVDNENTVTINGGNITGNKSPLGGGVYNSLETSMNLSGNVAIKENTIVDGLDKSNVYMGNGSYIGITSALTCGAESIGITTERWPTSAKAILIAQSAVAQNCDATKFFDDTDSYCIKKGAGSDANKLYLAEIHTHVWAFSNPSTYFMVYCDMDSSCEYSLASTDNKGIRLTVLSDNIEKAYTGEPIVYENYTNDITAVIGAEPTIYYQKRLENEALSARTTEAPTEMGSYSVIIGLDVGQYLEIYTNMTIGKAKITGESILTEPTARTGLVYDGSAQELVNAGAVKDGFVIKYSLDSVVWTEEIPTGTNANNYTVFWKVCGGEEYDDYDNTPPLFINVAPKDVTGATITLGQSLTYNGYEQTEQIVSVTVDELSVTYDVENNTNKGTNATTYTLKIVANGNFEGEKTVTWNIAVKKVAKPDADTTVFTYNGNEQTYTLVADDSYEISGNVGKEAVGYVAKVSLKDKVNCQWEDEKTDDLSFAWTIAKKDITNAVITLGSAVLVENGQVQTQVIESVKVGDITLTADDYTLSGNTATNAGTHTLTILAKGNFTGSVTQKFVILPKAIEEAVKETTTDGKEVLVIGDGNVNVEVKKENEATPETKLVSNKLDVIENVLDGTELSKVAGGEDYNIWIEVKSESAGDVVIEENKKTQIEQKVTERGEEYHVGAYIDISMYKKLASDVSSQTVRELKSKIKISISVPQDILKSSRSYFIIRNHDGEVEIIDAVFDQTENSLTFETDRFSAYAIGYHEVAEEVITNQENCKICNTLPVLFLGLCWRAWVVIVIAIVVVLIVLWLLIKNFTKKKKNGKGNGGNGLTETATMTTTDTTENVTTDATQTKTNDASEENVSVDQTTTTDKAENDIIVKDTTATVLTENETEDETEENDVESEDDEAEEETLDFGGSFARYNKSFKAKLIQASAEVQGFYQTLKNHLLGYQNVASRMSWQNDTVHTKRTNICKFAIRGKSLYIYLPLTDEEMQATNITKISQTKRYESVKSFTKIKGSLSLKRAIKGIDLVCARLGLTFVADQTVDYGMPFESTEALIEKGLIKVLKQRTRPVSVEEARKAILDSVALEKVSEQVRYSTGTKKAIINIDTISNSYKDGETVTVDNLIEKGLISKKTDYIKALARGTLDKSITVIADDFSIDAVKMILLAGGKVIKLVKKEK